MKNAEYECRSVTLLTPLGEVSGFADVLVDDDDECIEPNSEMRLRLYQAKYFLEDTLTNTKANSLNGFKIAYLLDLSRNSLSKTGTALGLTKERISQIRNSGEQALPQQHVKPFAQYILSCIIRMLGSTIDPWAHKIENYTLNPAKIGMQAIKNGDRNIWRTPVQGFIVPCNYVNKDRKIA